ncbi:hypothetical protein RN333_09295 [Enterobacter kobei]|uniref:hypothetical protein n=1 Tax=Enterobacter kobei TaxID=208224 RepID=UPI0028D8F77A|nr:hypothetical protein [Enterobacter kobei]WNP36366.1 hypothetical protein RN333_09295 [Enterobacter kobei]
MLEFEQPTSLGAGIDYILAYGSVQQLPDFDDDFKLTWLALFQSASQLEVTLIWRIPLKGVFIQHTNEGYFKVWL